MGEAFGVLAALAVIAGIVAVVKRSAHSDPVAREQGRLRHLRSAEFPATCSWCRNTTLARKLFVYERADGAWHVRDIAMSLQTVPDTNLDALVRLAFEDGPAPWKRLCSEKCVKEFLATERAEVLEEFRACDYCSVRFPSTVMRCTNCGAARK